MATVRFPISSLQRVKNRRGKLSVSCMVTHRWIRFREEAECVHFGDGELRTAVFVDVMTDASGEPRKLCELCITLEDLQNAVGNIGYSMQNANGLMGLNWRARRNGHDGPLTQKI